MKVLILAPALPYPAYAGAALRNYGLIRGLHDAGHTVYLVCFDEGTNSEKAQPLAAMCERIITVPAPPHTQLKRLATLALTRQPDLARRLESAAMRAQLQTLLQQEHYDVIQCEGLEMAIYLPLVKRLQPHAATVYDAHNAEYTLQARIAQVETKTARRLPAALYSQVQARRIRRVEAMICQQADGVIAVSEEDASALRAFRDDKRVSVVPNSIFVRDYEKANSTLDLGEHTLLFTGKMDYRPNVDAMLWFTREIFPSVRAHVPDAKLYIVGQQPHSSLQPLREQPDIELTGWVEKVQPYLHAASVYVAPLRMGAGTRLKLLEAMASGCAIVATHAAAAGLPESSRNTLQIADEADPFAQAILELLNDPARRAMMGVAAQAAAHAHHDWSALMPYLLDIHQELIVRKARG